MALHATHQDRENQTLCGQAEEISNILARTGGLPAPLHLTIEELLEGAWEIAYRKPIRVKQAEIVDLAAFRKRVHTAVSTANR